MCANQYSEDQKIALSAINNAFGVHSDDIVVSYTLSTSTDSLYSCILTATASATQPSRIWVLGSPVLGSRVHAVFIVSRCSHAGAQTVAISIAQQVYPSAIECIGYGRKCHMVRDHNNCPG